MSHTSRRTFVIQLMAGGATVACGHAVAAPPKIDEGEPKAVTLGYKHDTSNVDNKRFPKHAPNEKCTNCMAWLGKPSDPWAECDLLADRLVAVGGWCSSYVKVG